MNSDNGPKKPRQDKITPGTFAAKVWRNIEKLTAVTVLMGVLPAMLYFVHPASERIMQEFFGIKAWYHAVEFKITCQPDNNTDTPCSVPPPPTAAEIPLHRPNRNANGQAPNAAQNVRVNMNRVNFYHYSWKSGAQFCKGECSYEQTLKTLCATLDRIDGHHSSFKFWKRNSSNEYGCDGYGMRDTSFRWFSQKGDIVYATVTSDTHPVPGRVSFDGKPGNTSQVTSLAETKECFRILEAAYWDTSPERDPTEQSDHPHNISLLMVKTPCL